MLLNIYLKQDKKWQLCTTLIDNYFEMGKVILAKFLNLKPGWKSHFYSVYLNKLKVNYIHVTQRYSLASPVLLSTYSWQTKQGWERPSWHCLQRNPSPSSLLPLSLSLLPLRVFGSTTTTSISGSGDLAVENTQSLSNLNQIYFLKIHFLHYY